MEQATERQLEILRFICHSISKKSFAPSIREIGEELGIASTKGTFDHLQALERKGLLMRTGGASRSMVPTKAGRLALGLKARDKEASNGTVTVPVVGRVAAGAPLLAEEEIEESVQVDASVLKGGGRDVFALRIKGDSMIGDGILNGDLVFVRKTATARPGAIVVALIETDATCKRYFPEGDSIRFQPSNPTMVPIFVKKADFVATMIIGVVVAVQRQIDV